MRAPVVLLIALLTSSCSSSVTESTPVPDPDVSTGAIPGCYSLVLGGRPEHDVYLPTIIELSAEQSPLWVEPGHLTVREPGNTEPRAPFSSWAPVARNGLTLILGGGYTGYIFSLRATGQGSWTGRGTYFADFGPEPEPPALPLTLNPRSCS